MKFNSACIKPLIISVCMSAAIVSELAGAQQKSMTIEELEQYIQEQKAALEEVIINRDETEKKALEVREALEEQDARRQLVEEELDMLCTEQEALKPGTYDECTAAKDS